MLLWGSFPRHNYSVCWKRNNPCWMKEKISCTQIGGLMNTPIYSRKHSLNTVIWAHLCHICRKLEPSEPFQFDPRDNPVNLCIQRDVHIHLVHSLWTRCYVREVIRATKCAYSPTLIHHSITPFTTTGGSHDKKELHAHDLWLPRKNTNFLK